MRYREGRGPRLGDAQWESRTMIKDESTCPRAEYSEDLSRRVGKTEVTSSSLVTPSNRNNFASVELKVLLKVDSK
jgi:hypothetical protein